MTEPAGAAPLLRVVHGGEPAPEQLAALVAVLTARSSGEHGAPSRPLRQPLTAWVASGLAKGTRTRV